MRKMRFSERIGKIDIKSELQLEGMDKDLKNSIWNLINIFITEDVLRESHLYKTIFDDFFVELWVDFFKEPLDEMPTQCVYLVSNIKTRFFGWHYLEVYDFIDFIASMKELPFDREEFLELANDFLKRELSGYRFVDRKLTPIIDSYQIAEIEKAIDSSNNIHFNPVMLHLREALMKLNDRKKPDYRNSIKESISAVEAVCQIITEDNKAELGKALKKIENHIKIHGALKDGFIKIYGYTSDGDGIRHAILDDSNLDQEDAIYFLVSCSAFINYLMIKSNKAKFSKKL